MRAIFPDLEVTLVSMVASMPLTPPLLDSSAQWVFHFNVHTTFSF